MKTKPERADYMNGKLTHQEYYLALADYYGIPESLIPLQCTAADIAADPHINNVSLNHWDAKHGAVCSYVRGPWTLSDTVCTLKALAKRKFTGQIK